ncbi:Alpha/beta hydrolase family protein [Melia azedarach]|uniref:Alpha/beta hydrolase family protein n=1 Tax=Melia azedarach TaxID=155640 RepID=A0ACC1XEW8_MELAZ|nr:Alpha/beta hydrolase family protein [Melia azedarach]
MATATTFHLQIQSDIRLATSALFRSLNHHRHLLIRRPPASVRRSSSRYATPFRPFSFSPDASQPFVEKVPDKPPICTADELHYVSVSNCDWRLALWRYHPPPQAPTRNHPLLLLSGVGTNAIGYDLSPESSFARYMSGQGFDTWILEVRGAGLSVRGSNPKEVEQCARAVSEQMEAVATSTNNEAFAKSATNGVCTAERQLAGVPSALSESEISPVKEEDLTALATAWDESKLVAKLTETFMSLSERLSGFLSEGQSKIMSAKLFDQMSKLLEDSQLSERFNEVRAKLSSLMETRQNSAIASQIRDLSQRLVNIIEEGQRSVSPQLFDMQERLFSTIDDFQKQLDLIVQYNWDFDHYLEEDVPAAMEYIRAQSKPKDGKLLAIGHSMGGILLYSMLSRCAFGGRESGLAAIVTLASSLDYTSSKSTLKLLLPLADPAQALNVPVVPLGVLLTAAYPLSSSPPYVFSWLNDLISAEDMMHPELLKKLVLNNFCTIPAKLILQLTTAFKEGGLRDRSGNFFYKDHLHESNVPVLAIAGDQDLICPPEAVEETVKLLPKDLVTYKLFGEPGGPHYAHYDLVGGQMAVEQIYPCIVQFLSHYDSIS